MALVCLTISSPTRGSYIYPFLSRPIRPLPTPIHSPRDHTYPPASHRYPHPRARGARPSSSYPIPAACGLDSPADCSLQPADSVRGSAGHGRGGREAATAFRTTRSTVSGPSRVASSWRWGTRGSGPQRIRGALEPAWPGFKVLGVRTSVSEYRASHSLKQGSLPRLPRRATLARVGGQVAGTESCSVRPCWRSWRRGSLARCPRVWLR